MQRLRNPCENAAVPRHSAMMRALAALLSALLLAPSAQAARKAAAQKAQVVLLPYAAFPGVPAGVPVRIAELIAQELRGREELRRVELEAQRSAVEPLFSGDEVGGEAAPPPPAAEPEVPLAPLVVQAAPPVAAPEPARRVALPGAPVPAPAAAPSPAIAAPEAVVVAPPPPTRTADEPPSRALVIPRMPTPDEGEPTGAGPRKAVRAAPTHLVALEPDAIKTVREAPPKSSHTALWIVAGVLVAGAAAAGGYFLYQSGQTPTTANVNATWGH